jgi:hypothetical protein
MNIECGKEIAPGLKIIGCLPGEDGGESFYELARTDKDGKDRTPHALQSEVEPIIDEYIAVDALGNPEHHCGHEHDCCGCVFYHRPTATWDGINERWIITQSWGRNV